MANTTAFVDGIVGQLLPLGPVQARRMFGGHGLFLDGTMIALVASDVLYLKADKDSESLFEAAGSSPFSFERGGKTFAMSYWRAPDGCADDPAKMLEYGEYAVAAAQRAQKKKSKSAKKKR